MSAKSFVIIGNESLLVHCGEALRRAGHTILAVVTNSPEIGAWAMAAALRVVPGTSALREASDLSSFDVLLSVGNLELIPRDLLSRARVAAINFHDGPLPEHGGLNVPAWAIMRRDREHGISWHLMTADADAGAIIAERRFPIADGETTLTLNTRCFEAGIESFADVLAVLDEGRLPTNAGQRPQHLSRRHDRPPAAGALEWKRPAAELCALVRGLDYGQYANPLCTAKAQIGEAVLVVPALAPVGPRSTLPPGTIVHMSDDGVTITTGTDDVRIARFRALDGQLLSAREALVRQGLREGDLLRMPETLGARLTAATSRTAKHEAWWIEQLGACEPGTLPFPERNGSATDTGSLPLDLSSLPVVPGRSGSDVAIAIVAGLLARLRGRSEFSASYEDPTLAAATEDLHEWFAASVPVRLHLPFEATLEELVAGVTRDLDAVRQRLTFATDLALRQPKLRALPYASGRALPIAIVLASEPDQVTARPGSEVTFVVDTDGSRGRLLYDSGRLSPETAAGLVERLARLIRGMRSDRERPLGKQPMLAEAERRMLVTEWNATDTPIDLSRTIDQLVHERARLDPERSALVCRGRLLSYEELDQRVSRLARVLRSHGVQPDDRVAVLLDRDLELVVGLLAVLRAGGAYVPLDPEYPPQRLAHMIADSGARIVLTQESRRGELPPFEGEVLTFEGVADACDAESGTPPAPVAGAEHLAYVIYTSGSTGKPKGVMVEHRNVLNFVAAMDQRLGTRPGTWLAVTSASFDISVLELLWTLARGFTVVVHREGRSLAAREAPNRQPSFSLFYFSSAGEEGEDTYRLLLDGARFADARGFEAVWTPERHFHAFGGVYPNPAVTGAAVAAVTHRVRVRGGSVVLPLHHPARVAEEWAVVDNLSRGRVDIAFASGWQPNDFVLRPDAYADFKSVLMRDIDVVRRLWRGETVAFPGVTGRPVDVRTLPRPVQKELRGWLTVAGNPESYRQAGQMGLNVLTHLLGQSIEELSAKLALYRQAWREAGHQGAGRVTLMLHTFVGSDEARVKATVRAPLRSYLASAVDLVSKYAWSFPALKRRPGDDAKGGVLDLEALSPDEREGVLDYGFERYYETSGLFGTPESCLARIDQLAAVGVDEIACLIDFGVPTDETLEHLEHLDRLRRLVQESREAAAEQHGLAALIARHGVTHLQCTPSLARLLLADAPARAALSALQHLLVGGEALSDPLADELRTAIPRGRLHNMYGPTETTVWSTMHDVGADEHPVPIGRPLANTRVYVLDARGELLPAGVPGELFIGGLGVTRGYLGQAELTASRFPVDPFAEAGARMYRTGDRAQWRADGRLEFLGRLDQQVKLNGYRIELGEIESQLAQHPDVVEAAVMAREDRPGETRLVAYVVSRSGRPDLAGLKAHLRASLPDFMVPSHITRLDRLPLTPNGKLDRRALSDPGIEAPEEPTSESRPANVIEESIAGVWRDLLRVAQVSRDANFFDLGGHSLLAVQVHRRLKELFPERSLSITDLFRFPTILTLAAFLGGATADGRLEDVSARGEARRATLQRRAGRRAGGEGA
jgi:natural product biosynthesis luciferase-like monooxygenase protein